ncbi:hypothetical protein [Agarilytica rhodophyticola]|uniref:LpxL/LpxP family acyltransferase n=1 Tax=Agarilytica rhodophyticola TaxID=1737490 RepID=UPI000B344DB6|nr:hypothetical protein [Agarilytica rhodophyticola]
MSVSASEVKQKHHWANLKEAGTYHGFLFLLWVHKLFGRKIFSLVLYPVTLYFLLFLPVARRSSKEFLETHYQCRPSFWKKKPGYWDVLRHFFSFGQSILDKLLAWSVAMSEDEFEIADPAFLEEFLNDEKGQLIIGSHVGNLEYCRGFVQRYKSKTINILVYDQHSANFVRMMQKINSQSRIHVYQVDQLDIPTILSLKTKIDGGEWLFIAGDRIPLSGEQRTVDITFMGRTAQLPIGPYMLAKTLQCPVKLMFSYRKGKKVFFDVHPFADKVVLPRREKEVALTEYAQLFAQLLEKQCLQAPMQWFNFYPYWLDSADKQTTPSQQ